MSRSFWIVRPGSERKVHWAPTDARNSCSLVLVRRDRDHLGVGHGDLRLERRQLEVLLVLLRAVVAAREREDQRVAALEFAEPADGAGVVGERVIGEDAAGNDVGTHG
jgi:hypothetical protein